MDKIPNVEEIQRSLYYLEGVCMKRIIRSRVLLLVLLGILVSISLFVGVHAITPTALLIGDERQVFLFIKTRIPRTVSLVLAGAMMSVSGKIIQHFMQNKFVSAGAIGMIDSARFGILLVMLLIPTSSLLMRSTVAFIFAYIGVLIFLALCRILPKGDDMLIPLAGVMFSNIIGAIVTFFAYQFQLIQNITAWLQGDFATVMEGSYELIYMTIPIFFLLFIFAHIITVAGLGEEMAQSIGVNYRLLQMGILALVALGASSVLIMVGTVPFLGVVIPNLVSLYYGDHFKKNIGLIAVYGSIFLIVCDIISRVIIHPYEMPVSVIAGVIGGFLFLFILLRRKLV